MKISSPYIFKRKNCTYIFCGHRKDNLIYIEVNENENLMRVWNNIFWEVTSCEKNIQIFNKKRKTNSDGSNKNKKSAYII